MHKQFPFGSPLMRVTQPRLTRADAFVLGVYGSAVHASWQPPAGRRVTALAVRSEPYPFWDGSGAAGLVAEIQRGLPAAAGTLRASQPHNGPCGQILDKAYLQPLGLTRDTAWLADLLPESRMSGGQAKRVADTYAPLAERLGLPAATVPRDDSRSRYANTDRVEELAEEFWGSGAELLVTLGDAPLREFAHVLKFSGFAALAAFGRSAADYGRHHPFTFRGRRFELLPLAHPRQSGRLGASSAIYYELHRAWVAAQTTSGL